MLTRIYYCSTATEGVGVEDFKQILETAQRNNTARDLSGMLTFNSRIFLQVLEGHRERINDLYNTLEKDPRHEKLMILKYERISQRDWADWSMAFAAANAANRATYLKYSISSRFDPYVMDGDAVEAMMQDMRRTAITMQEDRQKNMAMPEKGVISRLFS